MDVKPKTLYRWYRFVISDYEKDKKEGRFAGNKVYEVDADTGEVKKEITVHILKPENVQREMCIDEKMIGQNYTVILSSYETGKIALLIDTMKPIAIKQAIGLLGEDKLKIIRKMNADMSPTIMSIVNEAIPKAEIVNDKFHVIKHMIDAVNHVRLSIKKNIKSDLQENNKNPNGWTNLEYIEKCKYWLIMNPSKLTVDNYNILNQLLNKFPDLKTAYDLLKELREWYDKKNIGKPRFRLEQELERWLIKVENSELKELMPVYNLISKHENKILGYFERGLTNAKAENLNGQIQRFLMDSYGARDRDFFFYRCQVYFA